MDRGTVVRLPEIAEIQMEMGRNVDAALDMVMDRQTLDGEDAVIEGRQLRQPGLLLRFSQGDRAEIGFPVGVTAGPGPGVVDVVVDHQDAVAGRIRDPVGGRHMADRVLPVQEIRKDLDRTQDQRLVADLLFVVRGIGQ